MSTLRYRYLGRTGLLVSELCLGTVAFGWEGSEETSRAIIDRFLEAGGNFIDTADCYGENPGASEETIGRALKGRRQKIVLATKGFFRTGPAANDVGLSRVHIMQAVEASLKRLQTDYIDLYYAHCWDNKTPLEESLPVLDNLVRSGKVRYLGASNFAAWQLMKALGLSDQHGWQRFVCLQPLYNLVARDIERELLPLCCEEGLGVAAWSPLGGGFLSGKYGRGKTPPPNSRLGRAGDNAEVTWRRLATKRNFRILDTVGKIAGARGKSCAQVSLAWVREQPGITAPIIGARTIKQLEDNLSSVSWDLTPEEIKTLDEVSRIEEGYPYRVIRHFGR